MTGLTVDTPESLMEYAAAGWLTKEALARLLSLPSRHTFLEACATIERGYTVACASTGDPCLASGCSCEGEACLQPLLRAGSEYLRACGAEWAKLFGDARNRDGAWRLTAAEYDARDNV